MVLSLIIIAIVVAAVLLSTPSSGPQFFVTVHVYEAPPEYTNLAALPANAIVPNATITLSGPRNLGPWFTPTGIFAVPDQIPGGTYTITAESPSYQTTATTYEVGANCANNQVLTDGSVVCHALARILK